MYKIVKSTLTHLFLHLSRKSFLFLIILASSQHIIAQIAPEKYLIEFKNKNNTPYSIQQPEVFLSQRAIDRRLQHNIPITEQDFPVNPDYLQAVRQTGVKIILQTKWMNAIVVKTIDTNALNLIAQFPFVKGITKSTPSTKFTSPPDPAANPVSCFQETTESSLAPRTRFSGVYDYGAAFSQIAMMKGQLLHEQGYRGQEIGIAVLDGGFTGTQNMTVFDSLRLEQRLMGTLNLVGGGTWVYQGTSHGSSVLSVMAANTPGTIIGTAPEADYWLVRTEDISGEYLLEEYNWIAGAAYADSAGADIISSSLAYRNFNFAVPNHAYANTDGNTAPITRAADIAASKGIIVVTSAGNNALEATWPHIGFPADADSALTVGAVDAHGAYAAFSAWGPTADGRMKPDVAARGVATFVADPNGGIATANGTSFAVPLISGLIACLKQACPGKNNMEILDAVRQSASQAASPDTLRGYGVPDFSKAMQILTGINDISNSRYTLNIFPNPFQDSFNAILPFPDSEEYSLEMSDIAGRIIFAKNGLHGHFPSDQLNDALNNAKSGTYFIKLISQNNIFTAKAVKQ